MEGLSLALRAADTVLQVQGTEAMEGPGAMEAATAVMGAMEAPDQLE